MKIKVLLFLLLISSTCESAIRFNPMTNFWEGNVCANMNTWTYVNFQPIGSFCQIFLPNGMIVPGQIVNQ